MIYAIFDAEAFYFLISYAEYYVALSCLQAPDSFACTWMEDSSDQALTSKLLKKERIL